MITEATQDLVVAQVDGCWLNIREHWRRKRPHEPGSTEYHSGVEMNGREGTQKERHTWKNTSDKQLDTWVHHF